MNTQMQGFLRCVIEDMSSGHQPNSKFPIASLTTCANMCGFCPFSSFLFPSFPHHFLNGHGCHSHSPFYSFILLTSLLPHFFPIVLFIRAQHHFFPHRLNGCIRVFTGHYFLVYDLICVTGHPIPSSFTPPLSLKERMRLEREAATRLLEEETEVRLSTPAALG